MKVILLLIFCLFVTAISQANELTPLRKAIEGQWVWDIDGCDKHVSHYSFSEDGSKMFVDSDEGVYLGDKNKAYPRITYNIIHENQNVIRASIKEEDRFSAIDQKVIWDLVMIDTEQFCWRRNDWPESACTARLKKCMNDS